MQRLLCSAVAASIVAIGACQQSVPTPHAPSPVPSSKPARFGYVVGQISPCVGLLVAPPGHPSGSVSVRRGAISFVPGPAGGDFVVVPTEEVSSTSVLPDGWFSFELPPGSYVLVADFSMPVWNGRETVIAAISGARAPVTVVPGRTTRQDVPGNYCI